MLQKYTRVINIMYVIATAVMLILSLTFMTKYALVNSNDNSVPQVIKTVREPLQLANDMILYLFVVGIIGFVVLNIFGNSYRKKLYKSNLIAGVVCPGITLIFGIVTIIFVMKSMNILSENLELVNNYLASLDDTISVNTGSIIIHLVIIILYLIFMILYIVYTIFKYKQTNVERIGNVNE